MALQLAEFAQLTNGNVTWRRTAGLSLPIDLGKKLLSRKRQTGRSM
jgi:hypothetical protein